MTNFFARVVDRALGDTPSLRPRLPARFEAPELPSPDVYEASNEEFVQPTRSEPALRAARPEPAIEPSVATRAAAPHPRAEDPATGVEAGSAPQGEAARPALDAVRSAPEPLIARSPVLPAPPPNAPELTAAPVAPRAVTVHEPAVPARAAPARAAPLTPPASIATVAEVRRERTAHKAPVPSVVVPASGRAADAGPSSSESTERGAPAVHITIGRVEVRAVSEPAGGMPRAAARQKRAALSLDEYQRQRNRGER